MKQTFPLEKIPLSNGFLLALRIPYFKGEEAMFIIDSGTSSTIIDKGYAERYNYKTHGVKYARAVTAGGMLETVLCDGFEFCNKFFTVHVADYSEFSKHGNIKVDVILGNDILSAINATINFKKLTLSIE